MIGAPVYYAIRLAKGAPRCGAKVWRGPIIDPVTNEPLDRGDRWQAEINGTSVEPYSVVIEFDGVTGAPIVKGEVIDYTEYKYLCDVAAWAAQPGVDAPEREPRKAIDLNRIAPIF